MAREYIIKVLMFDGHAQYEEYPMEDLVSVKVWVEKYLTDRFWVTLSVPKVSIEVRRA